MNKHVFEKIAKLGKTELSAVDVKLSLMTQMQGGIKQLTEWSKKSVKAKATIEKAAATINAAYKDIALNKGFWQGAQKTAEKYKAQMDKLSGELGVNLKGSDLDKMLSDIYMLIEDGQGDFNDIEMAMKSIGKV
jgi:hypothetical protein